jgi:hypothetical protein
MASCPTPGRTVTSEPGSTRAVAQVMVRAHSGLRSPRRKRAGIVNPAASPITAGRPTGQQA